MIQAGSLSQISGHAFLKVIMIALTPAFGYERTSLPKGEGLAPFSRQLYSTDREKGWG